MCLFNDISRDNNRSVKEYNKISKYEELEIEKIGTLKLPPCQ